MLNYFLEPITFLRTSRFIYVFLIYSVIPVPLAPQEHVQQTPVEIPIIPVPLETVAPVPTNFVEQQELIPVPVTIQNDGQTTSGK